MSVLVTGAAGFIGSHLCDALLAAGEEVVGFDCFDDFYDPALKELNLTSAKGSERFSLVRGDIRDPRALERIPDRVHSVVHLAARAGVRPSIRDPALYADVNVMGTQALLSWAEEHGVASFIFASSSSVYGNNQKVPFSESDPVDHPISPYAATKKAGELICHASSHLSGMAIACLRFFTVFGPRQRPDLAIRKFAGIIRQGGRVPMFGDGSSSRDYTYIHDTISGVVAAMHWADRNEGSYEIFNLGNNRTVTLSGMIEILASEMGQEVSIEPWPMQPGDVARTYADTAKAAAVLGYKPRTRFREGVKLFLSWFDGVQS